MNRRLCRAPLLITCAAASLAASAASAETLREALIAAYETNPDLAAARAGQKAVDEGVPIAKASGRPNSDIQSTYTENVIISATAFSQSRSLSNVGSLTVPIYQGGGVKNAVRAAETRVDAGRANLRGAESSVFSAVVGAYMDVIRDEAIVGLNQSQVAVLQVNLEATKDRFEIGDLTRTDVAQSEARLAGALSQLEGARANLIGSKEAYIRRVGRAPENLDAPPPLPNLPESPTKALEIALDNNPDIIASKETSEAARFDRKAAEAARLPTVGAFSQSNYVSALGSLSASAQNFRSNATFDSSAGIRFTIPIYQGGRPAARIRQTQAQLGQALEQEIATERNVIAQTRAAYASWRASLEVIASSERAVAANELSLEGVRAENSVGNRTILDILNAEQELLNSKVNLVTARRNAYVAGFSLLAAMGRAEARDLGLDGGSLYDPAEYYERIDNSWNDWSSNKDPTAQATRTVDTLPQTAEIEPLSDPSARPKE